MDIGSGKGASKCSKTGIEETDGSGISKHSLRHPELVVGNRNTRHSSERNTGTSDHSIKHLALGIETGRSKPFKAYPFTFNPDVFDGIESSKLISSKLSTSSSSSSSSSGSSMDDRFQANTKLSESRSGIASTSSSRPDEHHVNGSATSKSQVPSLIQEPTLTQSPPIQVMDRLGEYDPYRIPSSVFERSKSITPADWSIASNESLFSIQVENNSFSRDHILNLKSGELFKSDELFALHPSPVASAMDTDKKSVEFDKSEAILISDDTVKDKTGPSAEEPVGEKPAHPMIFWNSPTTTNHSDDTGTSVHSFAFPVLEDGRNIPEEEKREQQRQLPQQQQQQKQRQLQEPLPSAVPSKSPCCSNCCSCFPCCRRRWQCCNWHWHWRCTCQHCCRGKCR